MKILSHANAEEKKNKEKKEKRTKKKRDKKIKGLTILYFALSLFVLK